MKVPFADKHAVIRAAVLQMNTTEDVERNESTALALIERAASRGARFLVLPEKFHYLGTAEGAQAHKESLDGRLMARMSQAARDHQVYLVAGSIWEKAEGERRAYNTSVFFGPDGRQLAVYRKLHMFDVEVGGHVYRESDGCVPGDRVVAARVEGEAADEAGAPLEVVVGLSVCYDLRFPELYRALALLGAHILVVPAAFTETTGRDHWEVLLRARAIENQAFVLAANQYGTHGAGKESYGRSMIIDPWGVVIARMSDGEGVALADLDLNYLSRVRRHLPALEHRMPDAYERRVVEAAPTER